VPRSQGKRLVFVQSASHANRDRECRTPRNSSAQIAKDRSCGAQRGHRIRHAPTDAGDSSTCSEGCEIVQTESIVAAIAIVTRTVVLVTLHVLPTGYKPRREAVSATTASVDIAVGSRRRPCPWVSPGWRSRSRSLKPPRPYSNPDDMDVLDARCRRLGGSHRAGDGARSSVGDDARGRCARGQRRGRAFELCEFAAVHGERRDDTGLASVHEKRLAVGGQACIDGTRTR